MAPIRLLELFFGGDAHDAGLREFVSLWESFFCSHPREVLPQIDLVTLEVPLHLQRIVELNPPPSASEFLESLRAAPQDLLQAMACAIHALLLSNFSEALPGAYTAAAAALEEERGNACGDTVQGRLSSLADFATTEPRLVRVRLTDSGPPLALSLLRSNQIGRLATVEGIVSRVHLPQPVVQRLPFECAKCHSRVVRSFVDGVYQPPQVCSSGRCPGRFFVPLRQLASAVDVQRIRLQETATVNSGGEATSSIVEEASATENAVVSGNSNATPGKAAASVECELRGSLVGTALPGDRVRLTGIVKAAQTTPGAAHLAAAPHALEAGRLGGGRSLYTLYLDAVSLSPQSHRRQELQRLAHWLQCREHAALPVALLPPPSALALRRGSVVWRDWAQERSLTERKRRLENLSLEMVRDKDDDNQNAPLVVTSTSLEGTERRNQASDTERLNAFIVEIFSTEPRRFELLVNSVAPGIVGRHAVKAGLLLALLGGVSVHDFERRPVASACSNIASLGLPSSGTALRSLQRRGTIHVLLVGDAGVGKSRLLQAVAAVASSGSSHSQRSGVLVCGNTASAVGLTAAVVREAGSGELVVEAGALVLADGGVCCIDELDKMPSAFGAAGDAASLLEAMEQQTVSVSKASCSCCLPARTALIAAANPKDGKFESVLENPPSSHKTLLENLRLPLPLLSRFDLIFLLHDSPSGEGDADVAAQVFARRVGRSDERRGNGHEAGKDKPMFLSEGLSLEERLSAMQSADLLPLSLLQDYISYAREYVHPTLSTEAAAMIKAFFLLLREHQANQSLSVGIRQLESLIRLCQARARADLLSVASASHARDVIELFCHTPFVPPQVLRKAAEAGACTSEGFRSHAVFATKGSAKRQRRGLPGLVEAFVKQCASQLEDSGADALSKAEALACARALVQRAGASVSPEAVVSAANEGGFLLSRDGKWQLHAPSVRSL